MLSGHALSNRPANEFGDDPHLGHGWGEPRGLRAVQNGVQQEPVLAHHGLHVETGLFLPLGVSSRGRARFRHLSRSQRIAQLPQQTRNMTMQLRHTPPRRLQLQALGPAVKEGIALLCEKQPEFAHRLTLNRAK